MFRWLIVAASLLGTPAYAQLGMTGAGSGGAIASPAAGGGFTGPLDATVTAPTAAWCLRACSAAKAAALVAALNITNAVSSATFDLHVLSSGALDTATAISTLGADASGTGAITATTLTFTGGHVLDEVTGTGVTAGTYIVSGTSPTWTVNFSQTVASTTLTLTPAALVSTWYDQGPSGLSCTQATPANMMRLMLHGGGTGGSLPYILDSAAGNCSTANITLSQPFTLSLLAIRTGAFTTTMNPVFGASSGGMGYLNATNAIFASAGNLRTTTVSDSVWHQIQVLFNNAGSPAWYIDGTASTPAGFGANTITASPIIIGGNSSQLTGNIYEAIIFPANIAATQKALCQNQTGSANSGANLGTTCN